jgi:hypothetical protein
MRSGRLLLLLVCSALIGIYTTAGILAFDWDVNVSSAVARGYNCGVAAMLFALVICGIGDELARAISQLRTR